MNAAIALMFLKPVLNIAKKFRQKNHWFPPAIISSD